MVTPGEAGADTVDTRDRGEGGAPGHRYVIDNKYHKEMLIIINESPPT